MGFLFTLLLLVIASSIHGQEGIIELTNPYLQDFPEPSKVPKGWYDCGGSEESPPDILPNGYFGIKHLGQRGGGTYVGMVARDNQTTEGIGQTLIKPLQKRQCYQLKMYLAHSPIYVRYESVY